MNIQKTIADLKDIASILISNLDSIEYWKNEAKRLETLCIKYKVPYKIPAKKKTFNRYK